MKNFAKIVDLDERQVLFVKSSQDADEDQAKWLINIRFMLVDGSQYDINLGYDDKEKRDKAFAKLDDTQMVTDYARDCVDKAVWIEEALTPLTEDELDE